MEELIANLILPPWVTMIGDTKATAVEIQYQISDFTPAENWVEILEAYSGALWVLQLK